MSDIAESRNERKTKWEQRMRAAVERVEKAHSELLDARRWLTVCENELDKAQDDVEEERPMPYSHNYDLAKELAEWKARAEKAEAELAENEAVIRVWRGRCERAEERTEKAEAKLAEIRTLISKANTGRRLLTSNDLKTIFND